MPQYDSVDQLYSKVSSETGGMSKEEFANNMADKQKALRLYSNIVKSPDAKSYPSDFGTFYKTYNNPDSLKKEPTVAPPIPESQGKKYMSDMANDASQSNTHPATDSLQQMMFNVTRKEQQDKMDEAENVALQNPEFQKEIKLNPSNPDKVWNNMADKTFDTLTDKDIPGADKGIKQLVDTYYNTKDPATRKVVLGEIKKINDKYEPIPDEQWKQLQAAKLPLYKQYLLDKSQWDKFSGTQDGGASGNFDPMSKIMQGSGANAPDPNAAAKQQKNSDDMAKLGKLQQFYKDYSNMMYKGQSTISDPEYFWNGVVNGAAKQINDFAGTNLSVQGQGEYNQKVVGVLQGLGITPTEKQNEDATVTTADKLADGTGNLISYVPLMMATDGLGNTMKLNKIGSTLEASNNVFTKFLGTTLNKSFTNVATMEAMDYKHPLRSFLQGMTFSAGGVLLDKIGASYVDALGKDMSDYMGFMKYGTAKIINAAGTSAGAGLIANIQNNYYSLIKDKISGSEDLKKQFGTESPDTWDMLLPTTKDAIINLATMTMMGIAHGTVDVAGVTKDLVKNGFPKLADQVIQQEQAIKTKAPIEQQAVQQLSEIDNPKKAKAPIQVGGVMTRADEKYPTINREDIKVEKNKPSGAKAVTKTFEGDDSKKEMDTYVKKADLSGLTTKTFSIQSDKTDPTTGKPEDVGHQVISYDPKFESMIPRLQELITKENNGTLEVSEISELAGMEGQDPKQVLSDLANEANKKGDVNTQEKLENELNTLTDKTDNGNAARNEIADLNEKAKNATGKEKKDLEAKTLVEARKYGFDVHYGDKGLEVHDDKGIIGTDKIIRNDNADEFKKMFDSGATIDELNKFGRRENIKVTEDSDGGRVATFDGKVIAKDNIKGMGDFENPKMAKMINAIGNAKDISVDGMTAKDIGDAVRDIDEGVKSIKAEQLLTAADDMLTKNEVPMGDGKMSPDNFMLTHSKESPESLKFKKNSSKISTISKDGIDPHTLEQKFVKKPLFKDMSTEELKKVDVEKLSDKDKSIYKNVLAKKTEIEDKPLGEKSHKDIPVEYEGKKYTVREEEDGNKYVYTERDEQLSSVNPKREAIIAESLKKKENKVTPETTPDEGMDEKGLDKKISKESENPSEIIEAYKRETERQNDILNSNPKSTAITDAIGKSGISRDSYVKFGDSKKIGSEMARQFFKKGGQSIDAVAQDASYDINPGGQGTDITPQDVVDYMENKGDYQRKTSDLQNDLSKRYKDITGDTLNEKVIKDYNNEKSLESDEVHAFGLAGIGGAPKFKLKSIPQGSMESLPPEQRYLAESDNTLRKVYSKIFNSNITDTAKLKEALLDKAKKYYGLAEKLFNEGHLDEHNNNMFTAKRLYDMSKYIETPRDARNMADVLANKKMFVQGDVKVSGRTLAEAEMIDYLKKNQTGMSKDERDAVNKVINMEDYNYISMFAKDKPTYDTWAGKMFGKGNEWMGKVAGAVPNIIRPMMFNHNLVPIELRAQAVELQKSIADAAIHDRATNMRKITSMLSPVHFDNLDAASKERVAQTLYYGWHKYGKYLNNDELMNGQGNGYLDAMPHKLTAEEASTYQKIVDSEKTTQGFLSKGDKLNSKYNEKSPAEKKEFDEKSVYGKNTGRASFRREGDHVLVYHGLDKILNEERLHVERYKTPEEAQARKKELENSVYKVKGENGEMKRGKPVGVNPDGSRNESGKIKYYNDNNAPKDLIKQISFGDIHYLEQKRSATQPGSEANKKLTEIIDELKGEKYNPSKLQSNHISGAEPTWKNLMDGMEKEAHRAAGFLASAKIDDIWDKKKAMFNSPKYEYQRKVYTDWYNNLKLNSETSGIYNMISQGVYASHLATNPLFYVQQAMHAFQTVLPESFNEYRKIIKEQIGTGNKNQLLHKLGANVYGSAMATKSAANAGALTSHLIGDYTEGTGKELEKTVRGYMGKAFEIPATIIGGEASLAQKTLYGAVGKLGSAGKVDGNHVIQDFNKWFEETPEGRNTKKAIDAGIIGHVLYDYAAGNDAGGNTNVGRMLNGAATGYADVVTRAQAWFQAVDMAKEKGITDEDEAYKYAKDFVDRTKFLYGSAVQSPLMRGLASPTGDQNTVSKYVNMQIKNTMMLRQLHIMTDFYSVDLVRRAENKAATLVDIIAPRVLLGGVPKSIPNVAAITALGYFAYNMTQGKEKAKNFANLPEQDMKMNEAIRKSLGDVEADKFMYGLGAYTGINFGSVADAGTLVRNNMPLADQMLGSGASAIMGMAGAFGDSHFKLSGEYANYTKAMEWMHIMDNRSKNLPGVKSMFDTRYMPDIPVTPLDIKAKLAGFNTIKYEKGMEAEDVDYQYIEKKADLSKRLKSIVKDTYAKNHEAIDDFMSHPTNEKGEKAFGESMWKDLNNYNIGLLNDVYTAKKSLGLSMQESLKTLKQIQEKDAIGLTWEDGVWENAKTDLSKQVWIQKELSSLINNELKAKK